MDEIDPAPKPKRRTFTAADKLAHLEAYEALPRGSAERGAYLRRQGLYWSHLAEWAKQRDRGALSGVEGTTRPKKRIAEQRELERLREQNRALEAELDRTRTALEITGKVHALLEQLSESAETEPRSKP